MFKRILLIILGLLLLPINTFSKDTSASSIVMDIDTGRVLYEKNSHEKRLIASTTKIMTAVLAIENSDIDSKVKIGEEILKMYGTNIYIEVGEMMSVQNLLYGLILRSGNDAATALAVYIGNNEENFVKMMNDKAKILGMNNSAFENPHGLDDYTKNYSTAYDMALLSSYAYKNKTYRTIASTKKYSTSTKNKSYLWYNRNKLLSTYEYCTGGKNGYTPAAGRTLVTTASKNDMNLTVVTLNDQNEYTTHKYLYDMAFNQYENYTILDKETFKLDKTIYSGNAYIKNSFIYPLTEKEKSQIKTHISIVTEKDTIGKIGYATIKLKDEIIGKVDIYSEKQKKEDISIILKIKNYLLDILKKFILGLQNNLKPGPLVPTPLDIYKSVSLIL